MGDPELGGDLLIRESVHLPEEQRDPLSFGEPRESRKEGEHGFVRRLPGHERVADIVEAHRAPPHEARAIAARAEVPCDREEPVERALRRDTTPQRSMRIEKRVLAEVERLFTVAEPTEAKAIDAFRVRLVVRADLPLLEALRGGRSTARALSHVLTV